MIWTIAGVFISLFLCFVTVFFFYKRQKNTTVVILGTCDSGKSTLFQKIVFDLDTECLTSLNENTAHYVTEKECLFLVDIPGHEKLRYEYLGKHKKNIRYDLNNLTFAIYRAAIFVIDSSTIQADIKDVSEFLFNILTDTFLSNSGARLLIACNKQDTTLAKGSTAVKSLLEKELNTLAVTRRGALADLDQGKSKKITLLTKDGTNFTFSSSRTRIEFVECSAPNNLAPISNWLQNL